MDRQQFYRNHLAAHLDGNGDLAPPWERFPNYERHTIGWRMGAGEDWLSYWHAFLDTLAPDFEVRLAYLKRHPPAPVNWADHVYAALHPTQQESDNEEAGAAYRAELFRYGLIASDIAYSTWLNQQQGVLGIWKGAETPETTARYWTREFWFWSRQIAALRGTAGWEPVPLPEGWEACREPLETGTVRAPDLKQGLRTMAQVLAAGRVIPPWELGLGVDAFADSFEMDMGYVDAFRLWGMSALDDREQMRGLLGNPADIPKGWRNWVSEQFYFD